jgi:hypothetical protein
MVTVELIGRINEAGKLEVELPADLPPGEVRITIQTISADEIAADEALWDEQFAKSQDVLERMSQQAHEEYVAGLTEDFDPDDDE